MPGAWQPGSRELKNLSFCHWLAVEAADAMQQMITGRLAP
jgi:hypothetical protein